MMKRWIPAFCLGLLLTGCTATFHKQVMLHTTEDARRPPGLNFTNYDQALDDGYYLDVERFLVRQPREYLERPAVLMALARIALFKGDLIKARDFGEASLKGLPHTVPTFGKLCWNMALIYYFLNDFHAASRYAQEASDWGYHTDVGFRNFLKESPDTLYEFSGDGVRLPCVYGDPNILRFPVTLQNGRKVEAILDTGASLTFLSQSMAKTLGIPLEDGRKSFGYGLHGKLIPIHLVYLESLSLGGVTVKNVPAMVFADSDIQFGDFKVDFGLGFHLLRHGRLEIDYKGKALDWSVGATGRRSDEQDLYIMGLRPAVRVSINHVMGYHFILDTGSELTYISSQGSRRALLQEKLNFFSMITHGIGKSKANYTRVSNVYVGADRYMVLYSDVPTKSEYANLVDGILGNDFLDNFRVILDFPAGRMTLEAPR